MFVVVVVLRRAQPAVSFTEVTTAAVSVLLAGRDAKWLTRQINTITGAFVCMFFGRWVLTFTCSSFKQGKAVCFGN